MKTKKLLLAFCIPFIVGLSLTFLASSQQSILSRSSEECQSTDLVSEGDSYVRCGSCETIENRKGYGPKRMCDPEIE